MRRLRIRIVTRPLTTVQRFVTFSLLVHALVTAAAIWIPQLRGGSRIPHNATVVELVGALPAAPPARAQAPPPETKPEPEPEPPKPKPKPKKKPPEAASLQPDEQPEPEPKETQPEVEQVPAETEPEPVDTESSGGATADGAETAGSASTGGSVSALDLGDSAFAWYRAAVANALYGNWRRPVLGGLREPVEVHVAFEIMRDGNVRGLRIEQPSGVPSLDRSALRAVTDATPLPPLPAHLTEPYLPAGIVFRLFPEGH